EKWQENKSMHTMNLRSVFTAEQQRILERYYENGMTNQSKNCFQLILQCAQDTKLDFSVVRVETLNGIIELDIDTLKKLTCSSVRSSTDLWSCAKFPKCATIILVPQKSKITGLNKYRPVALTSVVMKSFERLVLAYLNDITRPLLDPLLFAYRANRSVDDAINTGLHYVLQHLDRPGNYARILFVNFSSAFNTIMPDLLSDKLTQLSMPTPICQWITNFLTDRQQLVKLHC
ncbi:putative ankyrin repeat and sterile alpha motif domain-containing protein 1B-like, partial [Triplophysa rosa]